MGSIPGVRKIPWWRVQKPTPVILLGKSSGQRSLVGYSPQGGKESDTTERQTHTHTLPDLALEYKMKQGKNYRDLPREHTGHSKYPLPTTPLWT